MEQEFGQGYAALVARSHTLTSLRGRTAQQAIDDGEPVRTVWRAVCADLDVAPNHHYLPDQPRKH